MPKFGMLMSKSKDIARLKFMHGENIILIEVKGQGHTDFMNVHDTSYHGDKLTFQTKCDCQRPEHEAMS